MHELLAKRSEELNFMKFMNVLEKQINKAKKYRRVKTFYSRFCSKMTPVDSSDAC